MKNYLYILIFFFILSCSAGKSVYWCGDHPCINKKEKEAYFKKTMIVEVREFDKKKIKEDSEIEKLLNQAKLNEKNRILSEKELKKRSKIEEMEKEKQIKLAEKRRIKEEKEMEKQIKLAEKRRIKEEKEMIKEIKLEEKRRIKEEKEMIKNEKTKEEKVKLSSSSKKAEIQSDEFNALVEQIIKRNNSRPFPEINDIPK